METLSAPSSRVSDVVGRPASNYPSDAGVANEPQNRFRLMLVHGGYQNLDQLIDLEDTFDRPLGWQANLIVIGTNHKSSLDNRGLAEMIRKITSESKIPFRVVGVHSQDDALASPADCSMGVIGAAPQVQREELRPRVIVTWMNKPGAGTAATI